MDRGFHNLIAPCYKLLRMSEYVKIEDGHEPSLVVFSAINFPPGKFAQTTLLKESSHRRIFVNTSDSDWYQRGIPDLGNIETSAKRIVQMAGSGVYAGSSMGGYGAVLFGLLGRIAHIIAVSAELQIGQSWQRSITLNATKVFAPDYADLTGLLRDVSDTKVDLFYGGYDLIDLATVDFANLPPNATANLLSGDHRVSEAMNWITLYAEGHPGVATLAARPGARSVYRSAIEGDYSPLLDLLEWSQFAPDYYFAGRHLMQQRDILAAEEILKSAVLLDNYAVQPRHALGLCLMSRGHIEEAIDVFQKALHFHPGFVPTMNRLAEAKQITGSAKIG
jgi:hypothetical protein